VHTFPLLLLVRAGVGIGEAILPSSASSLIADKMPRERLALAMSLFAMATSVGDAVAFLVGGLVLSALEHVPTFNLPLVGDVRTWQLVFLLTGVPGLLLAPLVFTFSEPSRTAVSPGVRPFMRWLARHRGLALGHVGSFCLMAVVTSAVTHWTPTHMSRTFHWSPARYGVALGVLFPVASILGHVICGAAVDRLVRRGVTDASMRFFAGALLISAPFAIAAYLVANVWLFLACLLVIKAIVTPFLGYSLAGLIAAVPTQFRAQAAAAFMLAITLLGGVAGPSLIAAITDFVFHDEAKLGWTLAAVTAFCVTVALLSVHFGRPALRRAVSEISEPRRQ
jgi:MFS family permease